MSHIWDSTKMNVLIIVLTKVYNLVSWFLDFLNLRVMLNCQYIVLRIKGLFLINPEIFSTEEHMK